MAKAIRIVTSCVGVQVCYGLKWKAPLTKRNPLNETFGIPDAWNVRSIAQAILIGRHRDAFYQHFKLSLVGEGGGGTAN
jgi:hypothetical protein